MPTHNYIKVENFILFIISSQLANKKEEKTSTTDSRLEVVCDN